jgi:uncharacterized protein
MARDALASLGLLTLLACAASTAVAGDDRYLDEIEQWRQKRETDLKADDGWLTVSGLFWLKPGETKIGSDPASDVLLPPRAPSSVGTLTLADRRAEFRAAPGVALTCNGTAFDGGPIQSDGDERPDTLAIGDLKLILLKRGARFALRLKDNQSPQRTSFAGLRWYPPREDWRIQGKYVAYPTPTKLVLDTIVGESEATSSPGYVAFERDGKGYRLQAIAQKDGRMWFVFRDGTSGRTTHGGARQLYADPPRGDSITLDFNKAVNLPCSYIPYATCPLAPPQNRLSLAIEAGELNYEPARPERTLGRNASLR